MDSIVGINSFREKEYAKLNDFIDDVHKYLSVKDTILAMGDIKEDDFKGQKICCPFHKEKTPSMHIADSFFRCYGCGAKGDIFEWIKLHDEVSFMEAVHKLAEFLQCKITSTNYTSRKPMQEAITKDWERFKANIIDVIKAKGKWSEVIQNEARKLFPFEVGYDPKPFEKYYHEVGYLVLPIKNKQGKVIGFTKRRIDEENRTLPKWIHSDLKNSLIGECHNIFNLDKAWEIIKNSHEVIFVEGPRDVAGMIKANHPNSVAVCGTSNFSKEIIDVFRPIRKIIFMYDGDEAGIKGMANNIITILKTYPMLLLDTYIAELPEGLDPGEAEKEVINNSVDNSIRSIEWFVSNALLETQKEFYKLAVKSPNILPVFMSAFNKKNCSTTKQSIEILKHDTKDNMKGGDDVVDYKTQLLVTAGLMYDESIDLLPITQEEAIKILELRYQIKP